MLLRSLAISLAFALLVSLSLVVVQAQEPTPTALNCGGPQLEGGSEHTFGATRVTLPAGTYALAIQPPDAPHLGVVLCSVETGALVTIPIDDCDGITGESTTTEGQALIDQIAASCVIVPTPTPEPPPPLCPQGEPVSGGGTITIEDSIQVTLPEGDFAVQVENGAAAICNLGEHYMLSLRLSDCGRPDIPPPDAPAQDVMAQIVGSCVLLHPVTPVPTSSAPPSTGVITPPSTGDAGLKSQE